MAIKQILQPRLGRVHAGAQVHAAGIIFVAQDTKNILSIYRSPQVVDPLCWCGVGGKIDGSETPEQAAVREASEEIQFNGEIKLIPILVYETASLKFHNFIGIVAEQFTPVLNWESDGYAWTSIKNIPHPFHYGLNSILADTNSVRALGRAVGKLNL